jgi:hypothetical protein
MLAGAAVNGTAIVTVAFHRDCFYRVSEGLVKPASTGKRVKLRNLRGWKELPKHRQIQNRPPCVS